MIGKSNKENKEKFRYFIFSCIVTNQFQTETKQLKGKSEEQK